MYPFINDDSLLYIAKSVFDENYLTLTVNYGNFLNRLGGFKWLRSVSPSGRGQLSVIFCISLRIFEWFHLELPSQPGLTESNQLGCPK